MLKTVYRRSCRDKHNCQWRDSNLGPLTPQSNALTTRLLRPARDCTVDSSACCVSCVTGRLHSHLGTVDWTGVFVKSFSFSTYEHLISIKVVALTAAEVKTFKLL